MSYVDEDETSAVFLDMSGILRDHQPCPIPKDFDKKCPYCIMCSIKESVRNKLVGSKTKRRRKWARRIAHLAYQSNKNCQITAHTCAIDRTNIGMISFF